MNYKLKTSSGKHYCTTKREREIKPGAEVTFKVHNYSGQVKLITGYIAEDLGNNFFLVLRNEKRFSVHRGAITSVITAAEIQAMQDAAFDAGTGYGR